jgi:protein phosphatase PTC7
MKINRLLVVADGVGGWKKYKVDPGDFARELCKNISDNFHKYELSLKIREGKNIKDKKKYFSEFSDVNCNEESSETIVKKLLLKSSKGIKSNGSSTCTILMLDKNINKMYSAYVGDSSYMILTYCPKFSKYSLEFKAPEQKYNQKTPYQIGQNADGAGDSITNSHTLNLNDIVIVASDGLWDNLTTEEIIDIVNENCGGTGSITINPQELANTISEKAFEKSNLM